MKKQSVKIDIWDSLEQIESELKEMITGGVKIVSCSIVRWQDAYGVDRKFKSLIIFEETKITIPDFLTNK